MSLKADVLAQVNPTTTYIGSRVRELINQVTCEDSTTQPFTFKKGDAIRLRVQQNESQKTRPGIVIKVTKNYLISIPLTTCEDSYSLCVSEGSRFFKEGWFCNTYVVTPIDKAVFISTYDNMKSLNNAIKELRLFINKNV